MIVAVERIYYSVCSKQYSYQGFVRWEEETGEKNEENDLLSQQFFTELLLPPGFLVLCQRLAGVLGCTFVADPLPASQFDATEDRVRGSTI
jgi:hypothetical protein